MEQANRAIFCRAAHREKVIKNCSTKSSLAASVPKFEREASRAFKRIARVPMPTYLRICSIMKSSFGPGSTHCLSKKLHLCLIFPLVVSGGDILITDHKTLQINLVDCQIS